MRNTFVGLLLLALLLSQDAHAFQARRADADKRRSGKKADGHLASAATEEDTRLARHVTQVAAGVVAGRPRHDPFLTQWKEKRYESPLDDLFVAWRGKTPGDAVEAANAYTRWSAWQRAIVGLAPAVAAMREADPEWVDEYLAPLASSTLPGVSAGDAAVSMMRTQAVANDELTDAAALGGSPRDVARVLAGRLHTVTDSNKGLFKAYRYAVKSTGASKDAIDRAMESVLKSSKEGATRLQSVKRVLKTAGGRFWVFTEQVDQVMKLSKAWLKLSDGKLTGDLAEVNGVFPAVRHYADLVNAIVLFTGSVLTLTIGGMAVLARVTGAAQLAGHCLRLGAAVASKFSSIYYYIDTARGLVTLLDREAGVAAKEKAFESVMFGASYLLGGGPGAVASFVVMIEINALAAIWTAANSALSQWTADSPLRFVARRYRSLVAHAKSVLKCRALLELGGVDPTLEAMVREIGAVARKAIADAFSSCEYPAVSQESCPSVLDKMDAAKVQRPPDDAVVRAYKGGYTAWGWHPEWPGTQAMPVAVFGRLTRHRSNAPRADEELFGVIVEMGARLEWAQQNYATVIRHAMLRKKTLDAEAEVGLVTHVEQRMERMRTVRGGFD